MSTARDRAHRAALAAWIVAQIAAAAVAAFRFPLWATAPGAEEQLALAILAVAQIAAAAMLFPALLPTFGALLLALAASWPMGVIAAALADASMRRAAVVELYVSLWLLALRLCRRAMQRSNLLSFASALATMWALGGPLLWYFHAEFGGGGGINWQRNAAFSPIMGVIALILPDHPPITAWIPVGAALALGALMTVAAKQKSKKFSLPD